MNEGKNFSSFGQYGSNFQTKVIQSLLLDVKFFERIYEIIKDEYFDSRPHAFIYKKVKEYYEKYKYPPSIENLEIIVNSEEDELLKETAAEVVFSIKKSLVSDTKYIKDEAVKFCRWQNMKNAIKTSVNYLEENKFEEIFTLVGNALKAGEETNLGHTYFQHLDLRLAKMKRDVIPTGMKYLDEILNGGLGKGELGVVVAGTGLGKSWMLCLFGKNATFSGFNVVHYTLELYEHQVGIRYDAMFTGIPPSEVVNNVDFVRQKLDNMKNVGKLIIKEYPTKTASVNTIRFHINKLMMSGIIPDLVIVDYADLVKSKHSYGEKRFELESVYEDLRALAGELHIPVWTASQTNRAGMGDEIVHLQSIAESFAKATVSDVIITISRRMEDKLARKARMLIAKNRSGDDGIVLPMDFDITTMVIQDHPRINTKEESVEELEDLKKVTEDKIIDDPNSLKNLYREHLKKKNENTSKP